MAKYAGRIEGLEPGEQVNTILFRLADELGYESVDGTITAPPDEILDAALKQIRIHLNEYAYPNTEENN